MSQKKLHDRTIRLERREQAGVSVFPLFDDEGEVQTLLVVRAGSSRVAALEWRPDLFRHFRLRTDVLDRSLTELGDLDAEAARNLAHLWHFDPWWVLDRPELRLHPAVPFLKPTNLPGHQEELTQVWFSRDLRRAEWIERATEGGPELEKFSRERIRESIARRRSLEPATQPALGATWRLRPFWQRERPRSGRVPQP